MLEVGAGEGELAAVLGAAGYDVTAIDPRGGNGVLQVALEDFDAPPRSFDAAVAMVSLHHVVPLGKSLRRLSEVLRHGARLVVDEIAIERFDERAAAWWLGHSGHDKRPADHVAEMREHLHSGGADRRRSSRPGSTCTRPCRAPTCTAGTSTRRCATRRRR